MNADRDLTDPALDAVLRDHSAETPPGHVDAAILAAAHRAVGSAPRDEERALASQPWRWWMPLAAAAAIGVVVIGVLPLAPTSLDEAAPIVSDSPAIPPNARETMRSEAAKTESRVAAPAAAPPAAALPDAAPPAIRRADPVPQVASPAEVAPSPRSEARRQASEAPPATSKPEEGAAATPMSAPAATSKQERASVAPGQGLAADRTRADRASDAGQGTAAEWIERIRTLRAEGKLAEAARELGEFRAAFDDADARLPADLRAWADSLR